MAEKVMQSGLLVAALLFAATAIGQQAAESQAIDDEALRRQASSLFAPIPTEPPTLKDNPLTPEKIELGQMLWFEPRLSAS